MRLSDKQKRNLYNAMILAMKLMIKLEKDTIKSSRK